MKMRKKRSGTAITASAPQPKGYRHKAMASLAQERRIITRITTLHRILSRLAIITGTITLFVVACGADTNEAMTAAEVGTYGATGLIAFMLGAIGVWMEDGHD